MTTPAAGIIDEGTSEAMKLEITEALMGFCARHNVTMTFKPGTFDRVSLLAKIEFGKIHIGDDGLPLDHHAAAFKVYGPDHGLKPEWLGAWCVCDKERYRLTGFDKTAKVAKVMGIRDSDGKPYRVRADEVVDYFKALDSAGKVGMTAHKVAAAPLSHIVPGLGGDW